VPVLQTDFQRHILRLVEAKIIEKIVQKKIVKIKIGTQVQSRLRNEINTYKFLVPWKTPDRTQAPIDKMTSNLPYPQDRQKNASLEDEIHNLEKGMRFLSPGTIAHESTQEKLAHLRTLATTAKG
jgi:hypothetical protein